MKRITALMLCAAFCLGLAPVALALAEGPTIQYAAITATAPDYSDATLVTEGLETWQNAAEIEDCVFVVIYSPDAAGTPPTLTADIELSQTDPGLILSDVEISGSASAEAGIYLLGSASVVWGDVTLTGTSETGDPLPALTDVSNAADVLAAIAGAKIRHTYTNTEEPVVVGMLSAYDLVIKTGVTIIVSAPPEGDYHHVVTVEHSLTVENGGALTADDGQELMLRSGAEVTGLALYEEDGEGGYQAFNLTGDADETFVFNAAAVFDPEGLNVTGLWVRSEDGGDPDPGPGGGEPGPGGEPQEINVVVMGDGSVSFEGTVVESDATGSVTVSQGDTLTIKPGVGQAVKSVAILFGQDDDDPMEIIRDISLSDDGGALVLTLGWYVLPNITLRVIFEDEVIDDLLIKNYAVLQSEATTAGNEIQKALAREFGYLGYTVDTSDIAITGEPTAISNGYGTFGFTVTLGGTTSEQITGYVVEQLSDVIFKFSGAKGEDSVNEIRVARAEDGINGEFGAPPMDTGFFEVTGVYNTGIEGLISEDVRDAIEPENRNKQNISRAFYRAQLHLSNAYGADPHSDQSLNWFMFDLIQDDALCVQVSASSDSGEQRTWQWELNRYAQLTTGGYTSEVYFANDEVTLSLPSPGVGGAESLSAQTGDFAGYSVTGENNSYTVTFHSNFYNEVTLDLTINGNEHRQLTIRRVGVHIADYARERDSMAVFHGTQFGSRIDFSESGDDAYQIYATYYLPDGKEIAPYGLYVTYAWADGTTTAEIITDPIQNPFFSEDEYAPGDGFHNGVFIYQDRANACDYLLYSGPNAENAPMSVSVTVLKNAPSADTFGGVSFGSGAGVTWTQEL